MQSLDPDDGLRQVQGLQILVTIMESGAVPRKGYQETVKRLRALGFKTAALTNNFSPLATPQPGFEETSQAAIVREMFDEVIESSVIGLRKPDPEIYTLVCSKLGLEPSECIFIDDIGANLKPAQAMGMWTIKVDMKDVGGVSALLELEHALKQGPLFTSGRPAKL